jgi:hypothetical protein
MIVLAIIVLSQASGMQVPRGIAQEQTPQRVKPGPAPPAQTRIVGEVSEIDLASRRLVIKGDGGETVVVTLDASCSYLRIAPGETSLEKATKVRPSEVAVGDRMLARGRQSEDQKSLTANIVVIISKTDLERKRERERAEWSARGSFGTITAIDAQAKEITIQSASTLHGAKVIIRSAGPGVVFRRYAPDSVRFSDASPSSFAALAVGDHLGALGNKSADGAYLDAEVIVSGSFRTVGGYITQVNAQAGEIIMSDILTKRPLTVVVNKDSKLCRITPEATALLIKTAQNHGAQAASSSDKQFPDVLERLPAISVDDLAPKQVILVSSTVGADPARVTAIRLILDVEPVFNALRGTRRMVPNLGIMGMGSSQ